jgi:hypothetical protein
MGLGGHDVVLLESPHSGGWMIQSEHVFVCTGSRRIDRPLAGISDPLLPGCFGEIPR